jgi:putative tryptophan/tyrosine transport system substrate-binding protein
VLNLTAEGYVRRRDFIKVIAGSMGAWPLVLRAQQSALPRVGFLRSSTFADVSHWVDAFRQGLKEAGFVEGQNVAIEFRSADNQPDRLPALVADLIREQVAVIVGNNDSALAAKAATRTIPIVFAAGSDPVRDGLVASLNRPGGNVTGVSFFSGVVGTKRLELLREFVPRATIIAMLVNPNTAVTEAERKEVRGAAQKIGQQLVIFDVSSERDIETAFATFDQRGAGALLVGTGGFLNSKRERIVALADRYKLPASYSQREGVVAGGLMSYGTNITDAYRQVGIYVGRILKGEKPADLPVMQSTKFEFVINLRAAKTLGLDVPDKLRALTDEVIE